MPKVIEATSYLYIKINFMYEFGILHVVGYTEIHLDDSIHQCEHGMEILITDANINIGFQY